MAQISVRNRNKNTDKKANWEYRFEAAQVDGKRKQISKSGFRTKKEALDAGAKALAEYNNTGLHFETCEISVADYLDYFFENYVKINLKYNSQVNRMISYEKHIKPVLGNYKLRTLTPLLLQKYVNNLKLQGLSKSSIDWITSSLSSALNYAVEPLHYIQNNPMHYVKIPKVEKKPKERVIFEPEDWQKIIGRFPEGHRFYIPLMIGYYTGMRKSEVFALTWDDINFDDNTININKQTVRRGNPENKGNCFCFGTPKTNSSTAVIKFGETLKTALKNEQLRQLKNEMLYGEYYTIQVIKPEKDEKNNTIQRIVSLKKSEKTRLPRIKLICVDENGEYTSTDTFMYVPRVLRDEFGIEFNFHSLRHTHATRLIEAGVSPKTVQARLRHGNITTTMQTYVHNTDEMELEAVEIFEKKA